MYIGVSYYPEFDQPEIWEKECDAIAEIGFNVVRMAEFAWCRMEPSEGVYDFEWLDTVIGLFGERGIKTILGTPTGAPPQWIINRYPDVLRMSREGVQYQQVGGFGEYCKNHPAYREYSRKIVHAMAEHFKDNPNVMMYQIDNEFMGQVCYCEHCQEAYKTWIKEEYKTIENYNTHLFTIFQGRELASFEEALIPKNPAGGVNPGLLMDYRKFTSYTYIDYCKLQADTIREVDSEVAITSNFCTLFQEFDHFKMAELFDVGGCDTYPKADNDESLRNALKLDLTRALKKANFWVLEQQCSPVAFREYNYSLEPLEARLYTYKSIAHGADGIVYFRWKATHSGGERFGAGILRHDLEKGRTYHEVKAVCEEIKQLEPWLDGSIKNPSKVAILYSNMSIWALENGRKINQDMSYTKELTRLYEYFKKESVGVDFVRPYDALESYEVIVAPMMAVVTKEEAEWLTSYVEQGGKVIFGFMSGMFDAYNRISSNYYQGELRALLGVKVLEWATPYQGENYTVQFQDKAYKIDTLHMITELEGATALATYNEGFYKGTPAITEHAVGEGKAYYVGAGIGNEGFKAIFEGILGKSLSSTLVYSEQLDVQERVKGDETMYFVMNHVGTSGQVTVSEVMKNSLTGEEVVGTVEVAPYDVLLLMHK